MPAQPNRSLADGIALFGALCATGAPLGSREAARLMGWEATRANRLLGTLRDLGLAEQDAERRYRPGPGVHLLAAQVLRGSGLLGAALRVLARTPRDGLGVALGVLWQGQVVYLLHAGAGEPIETGLRPHALFPAGESSIGMLLESVLRVAGAQTPVRVQDRIRTRGYAEQRNPSATTGSVAMLIPGTTAGIAFMADYAHMPAAQVAARLAPVAQAIAGELSG
ncbi:MAG TPA: transcriptional regulator [Planctomycetes bacterium]|nr:transcriptional regulator [Planctomycetota bacterium]